MLGDGQDTLADLAMDLIGGSPVAIAVSRTGTSTTAFPILSGRTTEGRNSRSTSFRTVLKAITMRITLTPLPVEPPQLPTNDRNRMIARASTGHCS